MTAGHGPRESPAFPRSPVFGCTGGPSPLPLGMLSFLATLDPQVYYCPASKTDDLSAQQGQDSTFTGEYPKAPRRSGHLRH